MWDLEEEKRNMELLKEQGKNYRLSAQHLEFVHNYVIKYLVHTLALLM